MIPLRDLNPTQIRPDATIAIIALNVLVFLASWADLDGAAFALGAIPYHFTGLEPDYVRGIPVVQREWWFPLRAITSAFMHGGVLHIGMNMWFLWVFGDNIEQRLGAKRYVLFYLACALGAVAAQTVSAPASVVPMIGASGAVSGVLGAYLRFFPKANVVGLVPIGFLFLSVVWSAKLFIGAWFVLQAVSALLTPADIHGGTAWWAHIGGFVVGYFLAPALQPRRVNRRIDWWVDQRPR